MDLSRGTSINNERRPSYSWLPHRLSSISLMLFGLYGRPREVAGVLKLVADLAGATAALPSLGTLALGVWPLLRLPGGPPRLSDAAS
jgi:hypothetical protein